MDLTTILLIQITITIVFSIIATIYDIKRNIVPDKLTFGLLFFGLFSNTILSLITNNIKFILASFISMIITYTIAYLLWKLHMWGGGDVKLFTAIATVIPFGLNTDVFNIFPLLSIYPFTFTVIFNSILVSFPFLAVFTVYLILKNNFVKNNVDLLVNVFNYRAVKTLIQTALNKPVFVNDLKEGMIINNYSFNDTHICELISASHGNLKVYPSGDDRYRYYFKSRSAGGITKSDVDLLKVMHLQKFISGQLSVKIAFPFTPAILLGLLIALSYGDLMMIFTKNFILVM